MPGGLPPVCSMRHAVSTSERASSARPRRATSATVAQTAARQSCEGERSAAPRQNISRRVRAPAFAVDTTDLRGAWNALGATPEALQRPHATSDHFLTTCKSLTPTPEKHYPPSEHARLRTRASAARLRVACAARLPATADTPRRVPRATDRQADKKRQRAEARAQERAQKQQEQQHRQELRLQSKQQRAAQRAVWLVSDARREQERGAVQCQGITKAGQRCRVLSCHPYAHARRLMQQPFCYLHAAQQPLSRVPGSLFPC